MPKTAVFVKLTAQPGKRDELIEAFVPMMDQVQEEPGTEVYSLHPDKGDADVLWVFELYTDDEALASHSTTEAMGEALVKLGGLLGAPPEMSFASPTHAKGFDAGA